MRTRTLIALSVRAAHEALRARRTRFPIIPAAQTTSDAPPSIAVSSNYHACVYAVDIYITSCAMVQRFVGIPAGAWRERVHDVIILLRVVDATVLAQLQPDQRLEPQVHVHLRCPACNRWQRMPIYQSISVEDDGADVMIPVVRSDSHQCFELKQPRKGQGLSYMPSGPAVRLWHWHWHAADRP